VPLRIAQQVRPAEQSLARSSAACRDADGIFEAPLPPGSYCAVGAGQREVKMKLAKGTDAGTAQCLAEQNAKCLATFDVPPAGGAPVAVVVRVANPCFGRCYHGPLPP